MWGGQSVTTSPPQRKLTSPVPSLLPEGDSSKVPVGGGRVSVAPHLWGGSAYLVRSWRRPRERVVPSTSWGPWATATPGLRAAAASPGKRSKSPRHRRWTGSQSWRPAGRGWGPPRCQGGGRGPGEGGQRWGTAGGSTPLPPRRAGLRSRFYQRQTENG